MREKGMTILVSTAYLDEGERCDRLALMHRSELLDTATPEQLRGGYPTLEEAIIERIGAADADLAQDAFGPGQKGDDRKADRAQTGRIPDGR